MMSNVHDFVMKKLTQLYKICFSDPLFVQNIRRFISTKADVLFKPVDTEEQERLDENLEDGKALRMAVVVVG